MLPTVALVGAVEVKVIVCGCTTVVTGTICCTCTAGRKLVLPAWLASITQLPAALKVTTPPAIEQIVLEEESMVIVTARPELAVAVGV